MALATLHLASVASLLSGGLVAAILCVDIYRRPQDMNIMNVVWPVTALFGSYLVLALYLSYGRACRPGDQKTEATTQKQPPAPLGIAISKATLHCGSGCCLGDICADWIIFWFPAVALVFGWQSVFADKIYAVWILDYLLAFAFGIAFQYFSIMSMQRLSTARGLLQALKADALSLTAWQVGMYGFMALAKFVLLKNEQSAFKVDSVEYWFLMQISMLCGFATSFPVNWALLRLGIKEAM